MRSSAIGTNRKILDILRQADWWRIILLWLLVEGFRIVLSKL